MPYDVFISHSKLDKAVAEAVCAMLEAERIRCWIAPRDIHPGDEWAGAIMAALEACRVMILVFSSSSNTSPQVMREVEQAFNNSLIVVPFRIEDVQPNPSLKYYIGSVHWLDALTAPMEKHIVQLVPIVRAIVAAGESPTQTTREADLQQRQQQAAAAELAQKEAERREQERAAEAAAKAARAKAKQEAIRRAEEERQQREKAAAAELARKEAERREQERAAEAAAQHQVCGGAQ